MKNFEKPLPAAGYAREGVFNLRRTGHLENHRGGGKGVFDHLGLVGNGKHLKLAAIFKRAALNHSKLFGFLNDFKRRASRKGEGANGLDRFGQYDLGHGGAVFKECIFDERKSLWQNNGF